MYILSIFKLIFFFTAISDISWRYNQMTNIIIAINKFRTQIAISAGSTIKLYFNKFCQIIEEEKEIIIYRTKYLNELDTTKYIYIGWSKERAELKAGDEYWISIIYFENIYLYYTFRLLIFILFYILLLEIFSLLHLTLRYLMSIVYDIDEFWFFFSFFKEN